MANYGEQLLSKVIDNNDPAAFTRFGIEREHFATEAERKAYDFIRDYSESNRGVAPSYATLVQECDGITYIPQVSDSYEYLTKKLKDSAGKKRYYDLLMGEKLKENFSELEAESFADWLIKEAERIKIGIQTHVRVGKTLDDLSLDMREEYLKRKQGKSFKIWKTPFPALNEEIGGLFSSDCYGIFAESGRGKSYLAIVLIDELLRQGANVLVKTFELKAFLWLARLISVATARDEVFIDEKTNQKVGLPNRQILSGKLEGDVEKVFLDTIDKLNTYYPGKLYLQAKGDKDLTRTLDELERELMQHPEIDAVLIDPFYGLSDVYGKNSNKTTGGAAEQAARRFENIVGANDVVGIYTVQATVEKKDRDEEETRVLKLPTRDQVKTTKALLDIATNLFSFDSNNDGEARLGVEKGRNGAEDYVLNLIALFDYGVLKEIPSGEAAVSQFNF